MRSYSLSCWRRVKHNQPTFPQYPWLLGSFLFCFSHLSSLPSREVHCISAFIIIIWNMTILLNLFLEKCRLCKQERDMVRVCVCRGGEVGGTLPEERLFTKLCTCASYLLISIVRILHYLLSLKFSTRFTFHWSYECFKVLL